MFYAALIIKMLFIMLAPILAIRNSHKSNIKNLFLYFFWTFVVFIIAYWLMYSWYYKNEVNVQHLVSQNLFTFILLVLILIPFVYLYIDRKVIFSRRIKISINIIALILLMIGTSIFGFVENYIYSVRVPLNKICHEMHNSDDLKLNCCLSAEYVWNEGFSFSEKPPEECRIFMNWNN